MRRSQPMESITTTTITKPRPPPAGRMPDVVKCGPSLGYGHDRNNRHVHHSQDECPMWSIAATSSAKIMTTTITSPTTRWTNALEPLKCKITFSPELIDNCHAARNYCVSVPDNSKDGGLPLRLQSTPHTVVLKAVISSYRRGEGWATTPADDDHSWPGDHRYSTFMVARDGVQLSSYRFRTWCQDVMAWCFSTRSEPHRQGPAIELRLGVGRNSSRTCAPSTSTVEGPGLHPGR